MADEKKNNARNYHVLQREGSVIAHIAMVESSSAEQAIRLAAAEHGAARYIAVPERSWTEINVKIETPAPRIILEDSAKPDVPEQIKGQEALSVADSSAEELDKVTELLDEMMATEEETQAQPMSRAAQRQAKA